MRYAPLLLLAVRLWAADSGDVRLVAQTRDAYIKRDFAAASRDAARIHDAQTREVVENLIRFREWAGAFRPGGDLTSGAFTGVSRVVQEAAVIRYAPSFEQALARIPSASGHIDLLAAADRLCALPVFIGAVAHWSDDLALSLTTEYVRLHNGADRKNEQLRCAGDRLWAVVDRVEFPLNMPGLTFSLVEMLAETRPAVVAPMKAVVAGLHDAKVRKAALAALGRGRN